MRFLLFLMTLFLPVSGFAQSNAATLEGCFTFKAGPYEGDDSHVPQATSMFQDIRLLQPSESGQLVLLDQPHSSALSSWEVPSADSVHVSLGYGFSGIIMRLEVIDGILRGVGTMWSDGMDPRPNAVEQVAITGRSIDCPQRERSNKRS